MIRIISIILFALTLLSLVFLAYLNSDKVYFDYLIAKTEIPLSILLLFCFLTGVLVSTLAYISLIFFQKRKIDKLTSIKSR